MFAYCGNNPTNNIDPKGNCFYNAKGEWCHDNWEYIGGYERKPDPNHPYPTARDVSEEVTQILVEAANNARAKGTILGIPHYIEFFQLVNHKEPWDIKREESWEETIGTRFPGQQAIVLFYNTPMEMDKLGNVTYGFLGYAYGIDLNILIVGSYAAAGMPNGGNAYFQEMEDWEYIKYGYMSAQRYYR